MSLASTSLAGMEHGKKRLAAVLRDLDEMIERRTEMAEEAGERIPVRRIVESAFRYGQRMEREGEPSSEKHQFMSQWHGLEPYEEASRRARLALGEVTREAYFAGREQALGISPYPGAPLHSSQAAGHYWRDRLRECKKAKGQGEDCESWERYLFAQRRCEEGDCDELEELNEDAEGAEQGARTSVRKKRARRMFGAAPTWLVPVVVAAAAVALGAWFVERRRAAPAHPSMGFGSAGVLGEDPLLSAGRDL